MKKMRFLKWLLVAILEFSILLMALGQDLPQKYATRIGKYVIRIGKGTAFKVTFSPDNRMLGVTTDLGVWLYDAKTQDELGLSKNPIQQGNSNPLLVNSNSNTLISPDGKIQAVADSGDHSTPGEVHLWDFQKQEKIGVLKGHSGWIWCIVFSPDSKLIATGGRDEAVHIWDVQNQKEIRKLEHKGWIEYIAFSPDGQILATIARHKDAVRIWNTQNWELIGVLKGFTGESITSMSISLDGKTLAWATRGRDISLYDIQTQNEKGSLTSPIGWVSDVRFSPNSRILASGAHHDNAVRLWDVDLQKEIAALRGDYSDINSLAFSSDGKILAAGYAVSGVVELWDVEEQKKIGILMDGNLRSGHLSLAFSPDAKILASVSVGDVILWDVQEQKKIGTLWAGAWMDVKTVSFSADGKTLAVNGIVSGRITLYDIPSQKKIRVLDGWGGTFSPTDNILVVQSYDSGARIWVWDMRNQREIEALLPEERFHFIAIYTSFSSNGELFAMTGHDDTIVVCDIKSLLADQPIMVDREEKNETADSSGKAEELTTVEKVDEADPETVDEENKNKPEEEKNEMGKEKNETADSSGKVELPEKVEIKPTLEIISGTVQKVDVKNNYLVVSVKTLSVDGVVLNEIEHTIPIGAETKIIFVDAEHPITFDKLKVGDQVSITAPEENGERKLDNGERMIIAGFGEAEEIRVSGASPNDARWKIKPPKMDPSNASLTTWGEIKTTLLQNFPNPFNPETWIPFELAEPADVTIEIYNAAGQLVRTLELGKKPAGRYLSKEKTAYWDGRDSFGQKVSSGVYFYTIQAGSFRATRRMVILK